jgi:hypothetical protein
LNIPSRGISYVGAYLGTSRFIVSGDCRRVGSDQRHDCRQVA